MAQITVDTDVAVFIDGRLRYKNTEPYFINDTIINREVALKMQDEGLITIVVDFVIIDPVYDVDINNIPEVEIKNDIGNPVSVEFLNIPSVNINAIPSISLNSGSNIIGAVKVTDGINFLNIDTAAYSLSTIDTSHRKIHLGDSFVINSYITIAAGATVFYQLKTNNVKLIHAKPPIFQTDGPKIYFEFLENPIVTDGTIQLPIYNRNRNSNTLSQLQIFSNPTNISGGNIVDIVYLGGGSGGVGVTATSTGSNYNADDELILKTNTNYVGKMINNYTETSRILSKFIWYETNIF